MPEAIANTGKKTVAVISSDISHRTQITQTLWPFYRIDQYANADDARDGISRNRPHGLIVDENLLPSDGLNFVRTLRLNSDFFNLPILVITKKNDVLSNDRLYFCGANAWLAKPYRESQLIRMAAKIINLDIERQWEALPPTPRTALNQTVKIFNSISNNLDKNEPIVYPAIARACAPLTEAVRNDDYKSILAAIRDHDDYTYAHSMRVATLLTLFGHTIGLSEADQLLLASGGLMHDVGKMYIPLGVLNKPGRLSAEEYAMMRKHVELTMRHLGNRSELPRGILIIAGQHHEKLDGSGYPNGLIGKQLNDLARMAAIVDIFSALTDKRVYKPAMSAEKALSIMCNDMAEQLDMHLLDQFRSMLIDTDTLPTAS